MQRSDSEVGILQRVRRLAHSQPTPTASPSQPLERDIETLSRAGRCWLMAFVAVMVTVPTVGLFSEADQVAFGWQMFSSAEQLTNYELERDGQREPLDLSDWVVSDRREFGARQHLPAHVCAQAAAPTAVWVVTTRVPDMKTVEKRHRCEG